MPGILAAGPVPTLLAGACKTLKTSIVLEVFDQAEPGNEYVITQYRETNVNLRTQLMRIIQRAGLSPWPKLFQNLRSTRETELAETFPMHVVTRWIGNSELVAVKHYL